MPFIADGGQQLAVVPNAGAASGHLRINPDQVDGAITVFQNALTELEDEVRWARGQILAQPLANDAVSTDAANAFNRVGYENADSAVAAWEGAVEQLRSIVEQLKTAKQTIMAADGHSTSIFQVPS